MSTNLTITKKSRILWLFFAVVIVAAIIGAYAAIRAASPEPVNIKASSPVQPEQPISSRMLFVGDVFWGRQVQRRAEASPKGYEQLTSGLSLADRAEYDAWIGNFECPITTRDISYQSQIDRLLFNCRPEYLPALGKYFTAASLANNHTNNNNGMWGLQQSREHMQKAGIQAFGTYRMGDTADICEVIAMPAKTGLKTVSVPVALCGYMYVVNAPPTEEQLAIMQQYAKVMPVIALPHMGVEYRSTAEPAKETAYRRMIDNGADMVIGAHPHVIQNSENYKGRLIAYSLGNFLFDQQSVSAATNLALAVGLELEIPDGPAADAYRKIGSMCSDFKDDCLSQLQQGVRQRPLIEVSYHFECYSLTSGVPTRGTEAQCATARQTANITNLSDLSMQW